MISKRFLLAVAAIVLLTLTGVSCTNGLLNKDAGVIAETKEYLEYWKYKQYDQVWSMLHPDCQASFGGDKNHFAECADGTIAWDFMEVLVGEYSLGEFSVNPKCTIQHGTTYLNHSVSKTYNDVTEVRTTITDGKGRTYSGVIRCVHQNDRWLFFLSEICRLC